MITPADKELPDSADQLIEEEYQKHKEFLAGVSPGIPPAEAWRPSSLKPLIQSLLARLKAAEEENDIYRQRFGCLACGDDHPKECICPPYEVRVTGMEWERNKDRRIATLEAENARLREELNQYKYNQPNKPKGR